MQPAAFDHEKLDCYRLAIDLIGWVGIVLEDGHRRAARPSALKHLDEASTSIALNIAEGNGKRSLTDRARYLDIARGSALESAACLDVLVARNQLRLEEVRAGNDRLVRIVSMLTKLIERLTSTSASTSTSTTRRRL